MFRRVIVNKGRRGGHRRGDTRRRGLLRDLAQSGSHSLAPTSSHGSGVSIRGSSRLTVLAISLSALLFMVVGELAPAGIIELLLAALLLGAGVVAARPRASRELAEPAPLAPPAYLDPQEQVRRQVRLLERRRHRCLETLSEVERCALAEQEAGRASDRLEAARAALAEAVSAIEAGIAQEQARGLALRVTRWMDRLPSLIEGMDGLDQGAYRLRLERLENAVREGEALATELQEHSCGSEESARSARELLSAGLEELSRARVDLLAHQTTLLTRSESLRAACAGTRQEVEAALSRGWEWLSRSDARREVRDWSDAAADTPMPQPEPVRILLPRGRDLGTLPFSMVLLGFTSLHASLAVGDIAYAAPFLLLPMAGFYALFLIPGVVLFREAVRARRREELTVCGSSVILNWRWLLWRGTQTVVAPPSEPVRRDEVGRVDSHPIHRLCLHGIDGRKLCFGFGLTEAQHTYIIQQMGRRAAPALPAGDEPASPSDAPSALPRRDDRADPPSLPLF